MRELKDTITDLSTIKDWIACALADAESAQIDSDSSKNNADYTPFDWTEEQWRNDGFGTEHVEALNILDECRQNFNL